MLKSLNSSGKISFEPSRETLEIILGWLTALASKRIVRRPDAAWHGQQYRGPGKTPIDALVDLNKWARGAAEDEFDRQKVDRRLMDAFLADLRDDFNRGGRANERSLNCVILLDNVHAEHGRRFLQQLIEARERVTDGRDDADPLTVVATSRGESLAENRASLTPSRWWKRYQLPGLTENEVREAVTELGERIDGSTRIHKEHISRVIFWLTSGHPGSAQLVLDALRKKPPTELIDPEAILTQPSGAGPDRTVTVEDEMGGSAEILS